MNSVGEKIKNRREELGLTISELAEKIGVSEKTLSRWESGNIANVRQDKALKIAQALDVSLSWLVSLSSSEKKANLINEINVLLQKCDNKKMIDCIYLWLYKTVEGVENV